MDSHSRVCTAVHHTYPTVTAAPDMRVVQILRPLYTGRFGETNAVLQYINQTYILHALGLQTVAHEMMRIAVAEMRHQEAIARAITAFGGKPCYWNGCRSANMFQYIDESTRPDEILAAAVFTEKNAVADYDTALSQIAHPTLRRLLNEIRGEEIEHLATFRKLKAETAAG
jgi:rubrerythrin